MTEKLSKGLTGIAGEHYCAAELTRLGLMASITLRNNDGIDILVANPRNNKLFSIQVKTIQRKDRSWPVGKKGETRISKNLIYIFVALNRHKERPDFFIVPSKIVAARISDRHSEWLKKPTKNGAVKKDTNMRIFSDKRGEFLEKWDVFLK